MQHEGWVLALVVAAAAHAGLELVVHLVVYPALAGGSAASPATALAAHEAHTRRMAVAVAPVYLALVVSAAGALATGPGPLTVVAAVLVVAVLAVTAFLAVPCHDALRRSRDPAERARLHRRLARTDLVRLLLAVALLVVSLGLATA
ncbi:hypothetical protein [Aquipuribacter nitratireducens]|uniref:DUF1772 domain-containing protein n=1 Tax=Aquipuribacter nitratireducens TaxID=650104 RepID=A0ABW0GQ18_9MICO